VSALRERSFVVAQHAAPARFSGREKFFGPTHSWARKKETMWKGFQKPKRLASELESLTEKYGRFSAQPFERGWGTTVGNALRRALLSSIEGAAITAVKIEGVLHEFSSIPGVVEDATDIILNLKQVPIKLNTDLPKTIYVNVEAPGPVTSAQIEEDADFAVLDKSVYIATVSEGGKLQIEMRAKNGRGYVAADRNYDEDLSIGYIPVDSVHSPVRKVNYSVEAARLGQMTDYEKLMIEVWTNGAITPQDSIGLAAKLVKDHMSIFINFEEPSEIAELPQEIANDPRLEHLDRSVEELELSVRSYNCLKNANIQTIRELVQKSENEMLKTKNFGRKSLNEIKEILTKMGLSLGMKFDEHGRIIWPPLPSQTAPPSSSEESLPGGL
jgi:DNA-directed RNA polymerase subunit alpha